MQSAAKLRRESNAAYQISSTPILDTNEYAKKEVGGRGGAYKSAAPRQEVAGRAEYVIRFVSKLGGEASPSLRWLRFCRRPLPVTTLNQH